MPLANFKNWQLQQQVGHHFLNVSMNLESRNVIYNNNQGAGQLIKNPIFHSRTKHIDIRHHFIREAYEENQIEPKYLSTEEMTADIPKDYLHPSTRFSLKHWELQILRRIVLNLKSHYNFERRCWNMVHNLYV